MTRLREKRRIAQARFSHESTRFLLCRPRGGLNDTLCQIHKSIIHSLRFNRMLVIDTKRSGMLDDFSQYFETVVPFNNIKTKLTRDQEILLNHHPCHPNSFKGNIDSYQLEYVPAIHNYVGTGPSADRPCISLVDPPETVLVHEQCGGGRGYQALPYFKFTTRVSNEITERLLMLPEHYTAIHIRYADVPFDYQSFLTLLQNRLQDHAVLMCTDSLEVLRESVRILNRSTIYQIANIPDVGGEKLHDNPRITNFNTNLGALADLIAIATAKEAIFPSSPDVYPSGFTRLATDLSSRDDLIRQLIGRENFARVGRQRIHAKPA